MLKYEDKVYQLYDIKLYMFYFVYFMKIGKVQVQIFFDKK